MLRVSGRAAYALGKHGKAVRIQRTDDTKLSFHRVGECTDTIDGIDRIMATGFNWAPPSVLVDVMGAKGAVDLIERSGLPVPKALSDAAASGEPKAFFDHPTLNTGKFFVAG